MKEMKTQSKNRDPFSRIPIPKSFYHPSQQKTLTKTQKKIALSPSKERYVSPEDEAFLKGSNVFSNQTPPTREHDFGPSKFDESWPSSERPSIASTSGYDRSDTMISDVKQSLFSHLDPVEEKSKTGTVLQRYVNRFRNSEPMSREERVQKGVGDDKDFWWLGKGSGSTLTPDSSSTPKDEVGKRSRQFIERSETQAYRDTFQSLSNARKRRSQLEDNLATQKLQEKADRILGQSESSLGSLEAGPAISSDGLASSESHSSSFDEPVVPPRPSYRTEFKNKKDRDVSTRSKSHSEDISTYKTNIKRPEDDILYQWRLQRKMDLSRHGAAELIAKNTSEVQSKLKDTQQRVLLQDVSETRSRPQLATPRFTSAPSRDHDFYSNTEVPSRLQEQIQEPETMPKQTEKPYIASPTLAQRQQGNKENMEPHLHLMCDVLPCPHAQKYQEQFKNLYPDSRFLPNGVQTTNRSMSHTRNKDQDTVLPGNMKDMQEHVDTEMPRIDENQVCDSPTTKNKGAQTQAKSSADSLNSVISLETHSDPKYSSSVVKSTEPVMESVDFECSDNDVTDRDTEILQDDEVLHTKDQGSSKRIPKSPTKSKVVHPKYSSSPARSTPPISSAIGQAVKDYMFTASSSVDSMTSLLSNIAVSSPDRQHTPTSSRRQGQQSREELDEQSSTSNRPQGQTSSREQTHSSSRQQSDQRKAYKRQQTSNQHQPESSCKEQKEPSKRSHSSTSSQQQIHPSSRKGRETTTRAEFPTPSQQYVPSSSRQYIKRQESSRRHQNERDSTDTLVRTSKDQSTLSSAGFDDSDAEDAEDEQRYSADIDDEEEEEFVSDDEFADDQLLRLLRQQRNDIERKLGEIDQELGQR